MDPGDRNDPVSFFSYLFHFLLLTWSCSIVAELQVRPPQPFFPILLISALHHPALVPRVMIGAAFGAVLVAFLLRPIHLSVHLHNHVNINEGGILNEVSLALVLFQMYRYLLTV